MRIEAIFRRCKHPTLFIILSLILFHFSCDHLQIRKPLSSQSLLDSLALKWRECYNRGDYHSVATDATIHFRNALLSSDSLLALYSAAFASQSFLFMDEVDSVRHYLNLAESMENRNLDPRIGIIINNVKGLLAVKTGLNYSVALRSYQEAFKWAESENDIHNQIIILGNIVSIFYIRQDSYGLEYARKVHEIASMKGSDFGKCIAEISMAQMLALSNDLHNASSSINRADSIAQRGNMTSLYAMINLIKAELHSKRGASQKVIDDFYRESLKNGIHTDPGTCTLVCLKYGNWCESIANLKKAVTLYERGLALSRQFRNMEFRQEILKSLSTVWASLEDSTHSAQYTKMYNACIDSVFNMKKEHEFNNLLRSFQAEKYQKEIAIKEIALLKSNRRTLIIAFCLTITAASAFVILLRYKRQRSMYRALVYQHQCYLRNLQLAKATEEQDEDISNKQLFKRIEKLMTEEKLFKEKNLTLDRVAEMAGTNRTYASKVINKYANMTFYRYIDVFRIRCAVEIMSQTDPVVPFKQIADDTGYSSLSVFYKAFQKETGCTPGKYRSEMLRLNRIKEIENK